MSCSLLNIAIRKTSKEEKRMTSEPSYNQTRKLLPGQKRSLTTINKKTTSVCTNNSNSVPWSMAMNQVHNIRTVIYL